MKRLRVIDLMSDIGGRSLGFERAGCDVVLAVDFDLNCKEVYENIVPYSNFLLSDVTDLKVEDFPSADVLASRIVPSAIDGVRSAYFETGTRQHLDIIYKLRPSFIITEAFLFFLRYRKAEFQNLLNQYDDLGYDVNWQIIDEKDYSPCPIVGKRIYIIGIRKDIGTEKFHFPKPDEDLKKYLEAIPVYDNIAPFYRRNFNHFITEEAFQGRKYCVRHGKRLIPSDEVQIAFAGEIYTIDGDGVRRLTHNELAAMKGLTGYDFNQCKNKSSMYKRIAGTSNVYVIEALARALQDYCTAIDYQFNENQYILDQISKFEESDSGIESEKDSDWLEDEAIDMNFKEDSYRAEDIRIDSKMISVYQVYNWINQGTLKLHPDYQRNFIWDVRKQSLLIESLMLRIPIPAFYLDEDMEGSRTVVDGMQRLTTIYRFMKGDFRLRGLRYLRKFEGYYFSNLDKKYQLRIEDTQLAVNILDARCPDIIKIEIFRRVNTEGMPLNMQEVRNIMALPKTRKLLINMSQCNEFIRATHGKIKDIRMEAQELCLRFIAYYRIYDCQRRKFSYFDEMTHLLDQEIIELNRQNNHEDIFILFKSCMQKCYALLGENAFMKKDRKIINRALFTSFSVIIANMPYDENWYYERRMEIKPLLLRKMEDPEYYRSISSSTSSRQNMNVQFNTVINLLEEIQ